MCAAFKSAPPQQYLSPTDNLALKKIRTYNDIIIADAEKGFATVVINRDDYE